MVGGDSLIVAWSNNRLVTRMTIRQLDDLTIALLHWHELE
jgi:hypothetical protein